MTEWQVRKCLQEEKMLITEGFHAIIFRLKVNKHVISFLLLLYNSLLIFLNQRNWEKKSSKWISTDTIHVLLGKDIFFIMLKRIVLRNTGKLGKNEHFGSIDLTFSVMFSVHFKAFYILFWHFRIIITWNFHKHTLFSQVIKVT